MTISGDQQQISENLGVAVLGELALEQTLAHYQTVYMPSRHWAAKTRVHQNNDIADLIEDHLGIRFARQIGNEQGASRTPAVILQLKGGQQTIP